MFNNNVEDNAIIPISFQVFAYQCRSSCPGGACISVRSCRRARWASRNTSAGILHCPPRTWLQKTTNQQQLPNKQSANNQSATIGKQPISNNQQTTNQQQSTNTMASSTFQVVNIFYSQMMILFATVIHSILCRTTTFLFKNNILYFKT